MRFTLNRNQTWLLFLPILLITVVRNLHLETHVHYFKNNLAVIRSIWLLNACLIAIYQAYLVTGFLNYIKSKSVLIKLNTLVAPVFFTVTTCVSLFKTFIQPTLFAVDQYGNTISPSMGLFGWAVFLLFALSIINIIYINNKVVANRVVLLRDIEEQLYAKFNFTEPLKNLLSATYGLILIDVAISVAFTLIARI